MLNVLGFKTMYITPSSVVESLVAAMITGSTPKDAATLMRILPVAVVLTYCQLSSKPSANLLDQKYFKHVSAYELGVSSLLAAAQLIGRYDEISAILSALRLYVSIIRSIIVERKF